MFIQGSYRIIQGSSLTIESIILDNFIPNFISKWPQLLFSFKCSLGIEQFGRFYFESTCLESFDRGSIVLSAPFQLRIVSHG